MRIAMLGSVSAQEALDTANHGYTVTSNVSQHILDSFNSQGGNPPLKTPTVASKDEPNFFDKAWGIFEKLGNIASPTPPPTVQVAAAPVPMGAILGIGIVGTLLFMAAKK